MYVVLSMVKRNGKMPEICGLSLKFGVKAKQNKKYVSPKKS